MRYAIAILSILMISLAGSSSAQSLSGHYVLSSPEGEVTLILREDAGNLSGTLTGTAGQEFRVEGVVEGGVAVGMCYSHETAVYFEAHPQGDQLLLALVEPDEYNMPDYSTATQLLFERQGGGALNRIKPPTPLDTRPDRRSNISAGETIARGEAGDPGLGFTFNPPAGWKWQQDRKGVLLGHDRIAGMILVFRHEKSDLESLAGEMREGVVEEGAYLSLSGRLSEIADNMLAGEYAGVFQGEQAQARGIGTLSLYGGGAFILALTTPERFGNEIADAADEVANGLLYVKVDVSELVRHFSGRWASYSGNTGGGTLRNYSFFPDGTFSDDSETSYNTDLADSHMEATGVSRSHARWTVRGTKERGQITIITADGEESTIEYHVYVERGQTYWSEYMFEGRHFSKQESY